MAAPFVQTCQLPEVAQGLHRKAVGLMAFHLAAATVAALVAKPYAPIWEPVEKPYTQAVVALCAVLAPCITLPFAVACRRDPSQGFACLVIHSITTGVMLHGAALLSMSFLWRPVVADLPLLSSFPLAAGVSSAFLVASILVIMYLATICHGFVSGFTPDDFMAFALGASCSLQLLACLVAVCFVMHPHLPDLSAEALRIIYYSFLAVLSLVAAGAWVVHTRSKEDPPTAAPKKEFRCLVHHTPFGMHIMPTPEGMKVNVVRGSAAARAGVLPGDILVEVAGQPVFGPASDDPASHNVALVHARDLFRRPGPFAIKLIRN